jgi:hypothetical protein
MALIYAKNEPPHTWRGGSGYREERYVFVVCGR